MDPELVAWLSERFDRVEDKLEARLSKFEESHAAAVVAVSKRVAVLETGSANIRFVVKLAGAISTVVGACYAVLKVFGHA
jgi:hypothetical protein